MQLRADAADAADAAEIYVLGASDENVSVGDKTFTLVTDSKSSFEEATAACAAAGGTLAAINSAEENQAIRDLIGRTGRAWIGLQMDGRNNINSNWDDGSAYDYNNWGPREPNGRHERCTVMADWGQWQDISCRRKWNFVCQTMKSKAMQLRADAAEFMWEAALGASDDNVSVGDKTFTLVTGSKSSFEEATASCAAAGGTLAAINSAEENQAIRELIGRTGRAWIGLQMDGRNNINSNWDDGSVYDYNNWGPREPNGGHERCTVMADWGQWQDISCRRKWNFVCQTTKSGAMQLRADAADA